MVDMSLEVIFVLLLLALGSHLLMLIMLKHIFPTGYGFAETIILAVTSLYHYGLLYIMGDYLYHYGLIYIMGDHCYIKLLLFSY